MNKNPKTIQNEIHLEMLKQRFDKDARFLSKDGFPFNAFEEYWQLTGLGGNGQGINTAWLLEMDYDEVTHIDIRITLASIAHELAYHTVYNSNSVLRQLRIKSFSISTIKRIWISEIKSKKMRLKSFIFRLYRHAPERYKAIYEWTQKSEIKKDKPNIYSPDKGALSDIETQSFDVALNYRIREFVETVSGSTKKHSDENCKGDFLNSFGNIIAVRLLQVLVRRPANLAQLKWCDIIPVGATFNDVNIINEFHFSDENELQIRMWKAKQKNGFRQAVEREPQLINSLISREILTYRQEYQARLTSHLKSIGITLTDDELNELMARSPLFFNIKLFLTPFSGKSELFSALGRGSHAYHISSTTLNNGLMYAISKLRITSDRIAAGHVKISNNRIRHTVGTRGNRAGLSVTQIAKLIGNHPESTKIYLDMSNEQRACIDEKFVGNSFLIQAFSKSVTNLLTDPQFTIEDEFGHKVGQAKSIQACHCCTETLPIGCYGCDNFQALVTGDHHAILKQAETKLQIRVNIGESPTSLKRLRTQINFIQATIEVCVKIIAKGRTLND